MIKELIGIALSLMISVSFADSIEPLPEKNKATIYMFDSETCGWCDKFKKEIGTEYELSEFQSVLPLDTIDVTHGFIPNRATNIFLRHSDSGFTGSIPTPSFIIVLDNDLDPKVVNDSSDEPIYFDMGFVPKERWYAMVNHIITFLRTYEY